MKNKRDLPLYATIGVIIIVILGLLLFLVFRPIEGEEEEYWQLYSKDWNEYLSQAEFQEILAISKEEIAQINMNEANAISRDYGPPIKNLILNPNRFNTKEIEINTITYQIAQNAIMSDQVKSLRNYQMDPLIILAQSNAENGGLRGKKFKLLSPSIPTLYLLEDQINVDLVKSFNIKEAIQLNINMAFNGDNNIYIGPLQLSPGYGGIGDSQVEFKDLLNYPAGERKIIASDVTIMAKVNNSNYARFADPGPGDRWNWNDACTRAVSSWDASFSAMKADKKDRIKDKYMLATIIAENHNIGCTVLQSPMQTQSLGFIKFCNGDNANIGDVWNFCEWLSSPNVITEIAKLVDKNIDKGVLDARPAMAEMQNLINKYGSSMNQDTFAKMNRIYTDTRNKGNVYGWSTEPPLHALILLYNYIMLEKLYSGR